MVSANTKKGKTLEVKWVDFVNVGTLYLNRYSGFKTFTNQMQGAQIPFTKLESFDGVSFVVKCSYARSHGEKALSSGEPSH